MCSVFSCCLRRFLSMMRVDEEEEKLHINCDKIYVGKRKGAHYKKQEEINVSKLKQSIEKLKNINIPILVMHGKKDKIVPFYMGKKIFELANEPKYSYFPKYDDHMMEFNKDLRSSIKAFIDSLN